MCRDYLSGNMAGILPQLHIVRKDGFNLGLCLSDVQDAQCRCTGHHIHVIYLSCSKIQHNLSKASSTMLQLNPAQLCYVAEYCMHAAALTDMVNDAHA